MPLRLTFIVDIYTLHSSADVDRVKKP